MSQIDICQELHRNFIDFEILGHYNEIMILNENLYTFKRSLMENNSNYEHNPNGTPNQGGPGGNRPNGNRPQDNGPQRPGGNGPQGPGGNGSAGNGNDGMPPKKQSILFLLIASLITLVCMSYFMRSFDTSSTGEIPYNQFVTMLEEGKVESVYITSDRVTIYPVKEKEENTSPNLFPNAPNN